MRIAKNAFERFFVFTLKILFIFNNKDRHAALLSAPIPETNMGDQALVLGALEGIKHAGFKSVLLFKNSSLESPKSVSQEYLSDDKDSNLKVSYVENLYLAFVTPFALRERLMFYILVARTKYFFVIGADIMDGTYGGSGSKIRQHIFTHLDRLGVKPVVLGFSLSEKVTSEAQSFMRTCSNIATFNARDEFSFERLEKYVESPNLVADIAFLMKPSKMIPLDVMFSEENSSTFKVGLCIKDTDLGDNQANLGSFVNLCENIMNQLDADIYLIPHHPADLATMSLLFSKLSEIETKGNVFIGEALPRAAKVKMLVSQLDFIVTARMHVAIAALGSGVPVLCITYGNKFEGLMKHFDLSVDKHVITEVTDDNCSEVFDKIKTALFSKGQLAHDIKQQKQKITQLALLNIPKLD